MPPDDLTPGARLERISATIEMARDSGLASPMLADIEFLNDYIRRLRFAGQDALSRLPPGSMPELAALVSGLDL